MRLLLTFDVPCSRLVFLAKVPKFSCPLVVRVCSASAVLVSVTCRKQNYTKDHPNFTPNNSANLLPKTEIQTVPGTKCILTASSSGPNIFEGERSRKPGAWAQY